MKRFNGSIVALVLAAAVTGVLAFLVLHDPPPRGASGSGHAPTGSITGHAVPRLPPPNTVTRIPPPAGVHPVGPGPGHVIVPHIYPVPQIGIWYDDWRYPYGYPPYGYPWPPSYPLAVPEEQTGALRLNVSPKNAQVYVDGYYAGTVDDFNGIFRHLTLSAGPHVIEMRRIGLQSLVVQLFIQPDRTITYSGAMLSASPGAVEETPAPTQAIAPSSGAPLPEPPGDLHLEVTPKDAQVYVDGYYVGIVDDFNGHNQLLKLLPGSHHLTVQAGGYETTETDVSIEARQTTTYRGTLAKRRP
ncbi:MAG TPA: PEGA domain-containing protein [Vicinamibacterales bacterium]|nr:PEGA domain-containing protein [Vicinamibacterales bacterium]